MVAHGKRTEQIYAPLAKHQEVIRGMVAAGHDLALVVEQPVKNMCGFAGCRRNHLGVERCVAVGEVRVELDPGFIAIMGVDAARVAAETAPLGVSLAALGTALYTLRARSRPPFPPPRGDVSALTDNDR